MALTSTVTTKIFEDMKHLILHCENSSFAQGHATSKLMRAFIKPELYLSDLGLLGLENESF